MVKDKNLEIEWKKKIISDLGLEKYNDLFSTTNEKIIISPYYTNIDNSLINPDKLLFPSKWEIIKEIDCNKSIDLTKEIKDLSKNGIINIILQNYNKEELNPSVTKGLNIYIKTNSINKVYLNHIKKSQIIFEHNLDVIDTIKINEFKGKLYSLNISSEFIKNSGSNIVQEIAFILSAANEYINEYGTKLIDKISFEVIQGTDYFLEIAKIQAIRILWSLITKEYGKQIDNCVITAKPSIRNKTTKNYNNNIIRSTSECMSGILGGCNFIKSIPYDIKFKDQNPFSDRIMNNQLLILKNETSIDKVNNAVSGSHYLTFLIEKLSQKSLNLFKKIENKGGYFHNLKNDEITNEILLNAKREEKQYNLKERILVGHNKYND